MKVKLTDDQWRKLLTPEQYKILREKGTEPAFTGELLHLDENGMYQCAACKAPLFSSSTKFDSKSGWPSFYQPADSSAVKLTEDDSLGMQRVEVSCANCGSHLGHVFNDAPDQPTGVRFCINSASLGFMPEKKSK